MIPVGWDNVVSRFAGISPVLLTLHKLYPAMIFCDYILYCRNPTFPGQNFSCNRFSLPKRNEKVIEKMPKKQN